MRHASILFVLLVLLVWPMTGRAQETLADPENSAPASEARQAESPPVEPAASAAPGEEVMKPTQGGLRFTPKMAKGIGRAFASELPDESARGRFAEMIERRCLDLKERYSKDAEVAAQHFYEAILSQEAKGGNQPGLYSSFDADRAREFSRKVSPGVKLVEEFWQGVLDDARQIMPDDRNPEMTREATEALKMTRRFSEKMDRWSRGEVKPKESLLDGIDENDIAADETGKSKEYIQAERMNRWEVNRRGGMEWEWFLNQCIKVFEFDDAQKASGRKVLEAYREKTNAIATKEWKAKVMANRVCRHLRMLCPEQPLEPWAFKLDQEFKQMTRPIDELGVAFRREVVALVRPDQWEQMLADMRKVATEHGMKPEELSAEFLPFSERPVASNAIIGTSP